MISFLISKAFHIHCGIIVWKINTKKICLNKRYTVVSIQKILKAMARFMNKIMFLAAIGILRLGVEHVTGEPVQEYLQGKKGKNNPSMISFIIFSAINIVTCIYTFLFILVTNQFFQYIMKYLILSFINLFLKLHVTVNNGFIL